MCDCVCVSKNRCVSFPYLIKANRFNTQTSTISIQNLADLEKKMYLYGSLLTHSAQIGIGC